MWHEEGYSIEDGGYDPLEIESEFVRNKDGEIRYISRLDWDEDSFGWATWYEVEGNEKPLTINYVRSSIEDWLEWAGESVRVMRWEQ